MKKQRGSSLILVLIGLVVLLLSTLMLHRTVQTSSMVANNLAYKQGAQSVADRAIVAAKAAVDGIANAEAAISHWYWPTTQAVDAQGVPTSAVWGTAPSLTAGEFTARYVVDRQCTGALPIQNPATQCSQESHEVAYSNKAGSALYTLSAVYYRVTVQVSGPKNTLIYAQATILK